MEIKDIKERLTLAEVIKHYGYKADKYNRINCPFHDDKTPSMQLYWKTHTAYCFSSNCRLNGKSIDVIDFILHKETCKIKLQPKTRQLTWGNHKIVPELRVNGNWLEDHGFKAGECVEIIVKENELIIKPVS